MGNLVLNGATSGATTLTPTDAVSPTLTLPSTTGTLSINGPTFSAYQSTNQSIPNATWTKITIDTKEYDTASCFNTSLYRFTPTIAGYYNFTFGVAAGNSGNGCVVGLYKNGSLYKTTSAATLSGFGEQTNGSAQSYANGSTDYFEIYAYQTSGSSATSFAASTSTYFQGCLMRGA